MTERPRKSRLTASERADQLMDVAVGLFVRRGYEGTSMEGVATAAGVSKPVVYTHFRSKEELYIEVLKRQQEILSRRVQEGVGSKFSADDPEGTIRTVYETIFRYVASEPEIGRFLYSEFRGATPKFAEQQERWRSEHVARMAEFFATLFPRLDEQDRRAAGHAVAISVSSIGRYGIRLVLRDPNGTDTDHLAELMAQTVVGGIAGLRSSEGLSRSLGDP
jgi:AcrR family transcriptional regulator